MKFGDIVINHWAGDQNPQKKGIFVRRKKETFQITNGNGDFWELIIHENKVEIVGNVIKDGWNYEKLG